MAAKENPATAPIHALTRTTTHKDRDDEITRTALVLEGEDSIDLVSPSGVFLARINIYRTPAQEAPERVMVDVIDVGDRYARRRAVTFKEGKRRSIEAGPLVGAHFEGRNKGEAHR